MTTCQNRAWQAAQGALICKQGVVGSSPIISTTNTSGQPPRAARRPGPSGFARLVRATSVPLGGSAISSAGSLTAAWTSSSRAAAMAWSPGHSDGHATDPAGTGSPPPTPRPPAKPSPARSPAGACIAPRCSATAPAYSSTHSSSPPGRNCSRCWMRAARTSCSARSAPPKPSTPKAGNGPGPNAATTPPPSTSSADQAAWDELQAAGWTARVR